MRAIVAGGAGFIGRHLVRALVAAGWEVEVVDNYSTSVQGQDLAADIVEPYEEWWSGVYPDVIVHLASPASPPDYQRLRLATLAANSIGTWNLLRLAEATDARFVFASTSEVYGEPLEHPQSESYRGNVDTTGPRSMYDESKRFGEALVSAYRRSLGVKAAIVRIFNTYGPGMRKDDGRVITEFIGAALQGRPLPVYGSGHQTRSFMYVSDLVDALMMIMLDDDLDGVLVNVGNPDELMISDLAQRVVDLTHSDSAIEHLPPRPDDPSRRRPDISRIESLYAWHPITSLDDGLRATIEAWKP